MIEIKQKKTEISVIGHAGFAPHGQDIVCAGVSTLVQTLIQSVEELTEDEIQYDIQPGTAVIRYGNLSQQAQLLVDSFFLGISSIAAAYPDNVMIIDHN